VTPSDLQASPRSRCPAVHHVEIGRPSSASTKQLAPAAEYPIYPE
jgi:hypothetical protein